VLLRNCHAQDAQRPHSLEDIAGHASDLFPFGVVRNHLLLDEVASEFAECFVVFVEQISAHATSSLQSYAMSSTRVALAVPPPSHMVCSP
jgi:hypothetical protein